MSDEDTWDKYDYDWCICGGDTGCKACGLDGLTEVNDD